MSSGENPRTIASVLGLLGSVGGFLGLSGWAYIFAQGSLGAPWENRPIFTQLQILVLAGFGVASVLGMTGSVVSKRNARAGGKVMLAGAGVGLAALPFTLGNSILFALILLPSIGWWAIILLFGGLFGILTREPHQSAGSGAGDSLATTSTS